MREEFFSIQPHKPGNPLRLLITGGSQGALPINRAFIDAMDLLAARKNELQIVHQTGERDYNIVKAAYDLHQFPAEVVPFLGNMAERFAWADLMVCRAGAITAAEVAAAGRAAIFIPFRSRHRQPSTAQRPGNGQRAARQLDCRRRIVIAERLTKEIFSLLDQPQEIETLSKNARKLAYPDAAQDIVDLIESAADIGTLTGEAILAGGD